MQQIFDSFNAMRVLIVGDVMIDRYIRGSVTRISPEAPVPIVAHDHTENRLGGAANVALNIQALGATPILLSIVGQDENGKIFNDILENANLSKIGIIPSHNRKTTIKTRILAGNQQLLRIDSEHTHALSVKEENDILKKLRQFLANHRFDVIILQDYNKGVLTENVIKNTIAIAKKRNIPITADPKKVNFLAYKNVTLFKPNLKEVRDSVPFAVQPNLESLQKAANFIHTHLENTYTLITLSEKGMFLSDGKSAQIIPTRPRAISDVSGAGDTVISVISLAIAAKMDIAQAVALANMAGGQVCEKVGVVPIDKLQLLHEFCGER
jgi:rfaE bifunctional protein kinase chain/domain